MIVKLFNKNYDMTVNKVFGYNTIYYYLYEGEKFNLQITREKNLYIFPHNKEFTTTFWQKLDINFLEDIFAIDVTDVIDVSRLIKYSIQYDLGLVSKNYEILI
jgi:hypothetical protein